MGQDEELLRRVRELLQARVGVVEKRSIGGSRLFMVRGHMCCAVRKESLMVRVGPGAYEQALTEAHTQPLTMGGKAPVGYVVVERAGVATAKTLWYWMERALRFVDTLPERG